MVSTHPITKGRRIRALPRFASSCGRLLNLPFIASRAELVLGQVMYKMHYASCLFPFAIICSRRRNCCRSCTHDWHELFHFKGRGLARGSSKNGCATCCTVPFELVALLDNKSSQRQDIRSIVENSPLEVGTLQPFDRELDGVVAVNPTICCMQRNGIGCHGPHVALHVITVDQVVGRTRVDDPRCNCTLGLHLTHNSELFL